MKKSYFNEFDKLEKNISINILIWVFIFLILLFSLILIFESPLLSILGFLTVLISIPPTGKLINNFFQSKYNFTINKKLKLIICFLSFFLLMNSIPENIKQEEDKNLNEATPKTTAPQKILGLMPVDIYLNFEKNGFTTQKNLLGGEEGNLWINTKEVFCNSSNLSCIDYQLQTFSHGAVDVESIRATVTVDMINKKINVALPFFESIINLLPFNNYYKNTGNDNSYSSNLKLAKIWIKHNFNKDKSSIIIGGLRLEIIAPTEITRMLIITCAPKDWNL